MRFDHEWVTPYLESGIWIPYYWGVDWGREYDDWHPGARFAAGLSVRLSRGVGVDLGCSQVLSHRSRDVVVSPTIPPIGGGYYYYRGHAPTGAYNEARFEATVCVSL